MVTEELQNIQGIKQLGSMTALESIRRNLATEDNAYEKEIALQLQELFGTENDQGEAMTQQQPMSIMCAGNMSIGTQPQRQTPPQLPIPKQKTNKLVPLALATAIGLGGVGAVTGIKALMDKPTIPIDSVTAIEAIAPDDPTEVE